jgi:hypothetical protein
VTKSWLLLGLLLVGCVSIANSIPFPKSPEVPSELGNSPGAMLPDTNCPKIDGEYHLPTSQVTVRRGESERKVPRFSEIFGLIPWSLGNKLHLAGEGQPALNRLSFTQQSKEEFLVQMTSDKIPQGVPYKFSLTDGDYDCEYGELLFPVRGTFGSIEGTTLNGQIRVSIKSTTDGSLIVIRSNGPVKSFRKDVSQEFTHEFYKFQPVD